MVEPHIIARDAKQYLKALVLIYSICSIIVPRSIDDTLWSVRWIKWKSWTQMKWEKRMAAKDTFASIAEWNLKVSLIIYFTVYTSGYVRTGTNGTLKIVRWMKWKRWTQTQWEIQTAVENTFAGIAERNLKDYLLIFSVFSTRISAVKRNIDDY